MEENKFTRKETQDNYVTEKVDIIKNKLLGNYDENGHYTIAPQIVGELLELKKYRKSSYGNSMFCAGNLLGYGEIFFEVSFDKNTSDNQAKAYLYVLEDVDKVNGYLQNTIKTKIAEFASNVGNFIEDSYKNFKISDDSEDNDEEGKEKKDLNDLSVDESYILAKKAYMLLLEKLQDEKLLDAYGKLFGEKISALTKLDSEFARDVIERFNSQYALIENIFLKDKNYKALNDLLDASIEYISGSKDMYFAQENDYNNAISSALQNFENNMNDLSQETSKKALNMLGNHDREMLEEMIDSEKYQDEFSDDTDNNGDGVAELEPSLEVFRDEIIAQENSDILENPILYDDEEKEESSEDSEESEEELENQQNDISEIINENLFKEEQNQKNTEAIEEDKSEESAEQESKEIEDIIKGSQADKISSDKTATEIKSEKPSSTIQEKEDVSKPSQADNTSADKTQEEKPTNAMGNFREYLERRQREIREEVESSETHTEENIHRERYQEEQVSRLQNTVNNLQNAVSSLSEDVKKKDNEIASLYEELASQDTPSEETVESNSEDPVKSDNDEIHETNLDYEDVSWNLETILGEKIDNQKTEEPINNAENVVPNIAEKSENTNGDAVTLEAINEFMTQDQEYTR